MLEDALIDQENVWQRHCRVLRDCAGRRGARKMKRETGVAVITEVRPTSIPGPGLAEAAASGT